MGNKKENPRNVSPYESPTIGHYLLEFEPELVQSAVEKKLPICSICFKGLVESVNSDNSKESFKCTNCGSTSFVRCPKCQSVTGEVGLLNNGKGCPSCSGMYIGLRRKLEQATTG